MFNGASNTMNGTKEFLQSNSLIAKVAFLILILILFQLHSRTLINYKKSIIGVLICLTF